MGASNRTHFFLNFLGIVIKIYYICSMKVIQITKKTSNKTEQMETLISILCFLNGMHISKTDISVLAHYVIFGIKKATDDLLINSKILRDQIALRNTKSRLTKKGFLKRTKELYKSYELNIDKDFKNGSDDVTVLIKLDNS
jgi:hypothetical protein